MSLHKTQTTFKNMMINHHIDKPDELFKDGGISIEKRMNTYKNNYSVGLCEVLAGTFQTVTDLVGEEFMKRMCEHFIREHPPKKACMHEYGEELAEFVQKFDPVKSLAYLPDIARLDWAANTAYHADNVVPLSMENIGSIGNAFEEDNFKLELHPSVTLMKSIFKIHDIRQYVRDKERQEQEKLNINESETFLLVSRKEDQVYIIELTQAEYHFLQDTSPLMEAVENTLDKFSEFNFQETLEKYLSCETYLVPTTNT